MSKNTHHTHKEHADTVRYHTHALLAATADAADEKVVEVRNRLTSALAAAKETYEAVQEKAVESAKTADKAIRANPYQAVGIAVGLGALIGFLIGRRNKNAS